MARVWTSELETSVSLKGWKYPAIAHFEVDTGDVKLVAITVRKRNVLHLTCERQQAIIVEDIYRDIAK